MTLDLLTVVLLTALSAFLMGASISLAGLTQSVSDPALKSLRSGCLGQSLGWILIGLRGRIPDALSIFGGNWVLLASGLCYLHAVNVFLDASAPSSKRGAAPWLPNALWALGTVATVGLLYFSFSRPHMAARIVVTSLGHGLISSFCAARLLNRREIPASRRIVGLGFGLSVVVHLSRIAMIWLDPPRSGEVLAAIASQTGTLIWGHIAVVMLTFLFVLMLHDHTARDLRELVTHDYLTGIFNRSSFEGFSRQAIEQARRSGEALTLLLFDVDHFKAINDSLGHLTGDVALRNLADLADEKLRSQDIFGRYGGEEFAVLLPATDANGAFLVAERIRESVAQAEFRDEATRFRLTISIGIAQVALDGPTSTEQRLTALFRAADAALYEAKGSGRNRTVIAAPEQTMPAIPPPPRNDLSPEA